ncbi:hypothetical protein V8C26DRAFT_398292 [Trichoderma gracile]
MYGIDILLLVALLTITLGADFARPVSASMRDGHGWLGCSIRLHIPRLLSGSRPRFPCLETLMASQVHVPPDCHTTRIESDWVHHYMQKKCTSMKKSCVSRIDQLMYSDSRPG